MAFPLKSDRLYVWHHLEGNEPDWFIPRAEHKNLVYRVKSVKKTYCHIQVFLGKGHTYGITKTI